MLTPDEAEEMAGYWRPQFASEENFDRSWAKYFSMVGQPTHGGLEMWLRNDQLRDAVEARGRKKPEPLLPVRSTYEPNDCSDCGGKRYVRREVPISDASFGVAMPCPACSDGAGKREWVEAS